ncbi:MAG: hypothetical protein ACYDCC_13135 [Actinomycetota bacterium]
MQFGVLVHRTKQVRRLAMIQCEMCGMEVPMGGNGRCFIGHLQPGAQGVAVPAVAPAPAQSFAASTVAFEPEPPRSGLFEKEAPHEIAAALQEFEATRPIDPPSQPMLQPLAPLMPQVSETQPAAPAPFAAQSQPFVVPSSPVVAPSMPVTPAASIVGTSVLAPAPLESVAPAHATPDLFLVGGEAKPPRKLNKSLIIMLAVAVVGSVGVFVTRGMVNGSSQTAAAQSKMISSATLLHTFTPGESHNYHLSMFMRMSADIGGTKHMVGEKIDMDFTERVLSRSTDGSTTLAFIFNELRATRDGQSLPIPIAQGASVEMRLSSNGTVLSTTSHGLPSSSQSSVGDSFYSGLEPLLPPNAHVGSEWVSSKTTNLPSLSGPLTITNHYTLTREDSAQAFVHVDSEGLVNSTIRVPQLTAGSLPQEPQMHGRVLGSGDEVVDRSTGRVLQQNARAVTTVAISEGSQTMTMQIQLTFQLMQTSGTIGKQSPSGNPVA